MYPLRTITLAAILLLPFPLLRLAAQDTNPEARYTALLDRLVNGDSTVDFGELRMAYTKTPAYAPYEFYLEEKQAMFGALRRGDHAEALEQAGHILQRNYLLIAAHICCQAAYEATGQTEKSNYHQRVIRGIIGSIMGENDGRTPETAYTVISIDEEYALLQIFGLERKKQRLFEQDGSMYDGLSVVDTETGEAQEIFFNVDLPIRSMSLKD